MSMAKIYLFCIHSFPDQAEVFSSFTSKYQGCFENILDPLAYYFQIVQEFTSATPLQRTGT